MATMESTIAAIANKERELLFFDLVNAHGKPVGIKGSEKLG